MYEARTFTFKKKPRIILDKRFKQFHSLQVGDKGQCVIEGSISGERQEMSEDGNEYLIKTIEINSAEIINDKITRTSL